MRALALVLAAAQLAGCASRAPGSARTFIISAASVTVRVIGPRCATVPKGDSGHAGTRPKVGFRPNSPVNEARSAVSTESLVEKNDTACE